MDPRRFVAARRRHLVGGAEAEVAGAFGPGGEFAGDVDGDPGAGRAQAGEGERDRDRRRPAAEQAVAAERHVERVDADRLGART